MRPRLTDFQVAALSSLETVSVCKLTGSAWDMQAAGGPKLVPQRTFAALVAAGALVPDGGDGGTSYWVPGPGFKDSGQIG